MSHDLNFSPLMKGILLAIFSLILGSSEDSIEIPFTESSILVQKVDNANLFPHRNSSIVQLPIEMLLEIGRYAHFSYFEICKSVYNESNRPEFMKTLRWAACQNLVWVYRCHTGSHKLSLFLDCYDEFDFTEIDELFNEFFVSQIRFKNLISVLKFSEKGYNGKNFNKQGSFLLDADHISALQDGMLNECRISVLTSLDIDRYLNSDNLPNLHFGNIELTILAHDNPSKLVELISMLKFDSMYLLSRENPLVEMFDSLDDSLKSKMKFVLHHKAAESEDCHSIFGLLPDLRFLSIEFIQANHLKSLKPATVYEFIMCKSILRELEIRFEIKGTQTEDCVVYFNRFTTAMTDFISSLSFPFKLKLYYGFRESQESKIESDF